MKRIVMFRWADPLAILLLLVAAWMLTDRAAGMAKGAVATVRVNGAPVLELDLFEEGHHSIHGPLGATLIETGEGSVRVTSSPCPNHICVKMGKISRNGQTLLCVPNHVSIEVSGGGEPGVDGVTG